MSIIVRVESAADGSQTPHDGRYVVAWDPHTTFGTLALTSTADLTEARRFTSFAVAMTEWKTISRRQPNRPDGKPNRPLSSINVTFERAPEDR